MRNYNYRPFSEEQTIRALENSLYNIIAVDDKDVVGMGRLIGDGLYFTVVDIVVAPEYQGKGIGSELIKRILNYADSQTPPGGRASVQLISEKGKESFYEKAGFKKIPHQYCGFGMRKVIHKENRIQI
ncbi:GNAT family N-acetyltransferase [Anaerocolumna sp. MB42-C2]|uniref:GNAT family N-acetyltransferase n=1 Tax=Anaerocolumna sp. MB42-C2 TaxID=3070997 RepID=UPI0027E15E7F|nr:GNAT family N-acetyltransferase [Anaerocolumna sp. MB42-C2]WMJ88505.1 GNAT family N-acetyltransferase [Anaerocolumna sp. MB42-C2]